MQTKRWKDAKKTCEKSLKGIDKVYILCYNNSVKGRYKKNPG